MKQLNCAKVYSTSKNLTNKTMLHAHQTKNTLLSSYHKNVKYKEKRK